MNIVAATATERFVGPPEEPHQVVRVTLDGPGSGRLEIDGVDVATVASVAVERQAHDGPTTIEVPVGVTDDRVPGDRLDARVSLSGPDAGSHDFTFVVGEPGWRMFMVSHFHYDPVWWNTQASYTETWEKLAMDVRPWEGRRQQPAFTLIDAHLAEAAHDPDYRFVLAELDYLKPWWDTFPERRDEFRRLLADERLELMGGTYNEPNTNLTGAETTARSAVHGIGYQRTVLGGDPATAWQLDVFGHDPQFPGMMADAGLSSSSWARGPHHQWGPARSSQGNAGMQFPSEFEWVSPSGRGLLTSYMPNHYSAGWEFDKATTLEDALEQAWQLFVDLRQVAATRNVLLPVGSDYTPPNRWLTAVHRAWNARYTWPRFEVALPREFFAAVRSELTARGGASPQTRDMNPVYTGKDVSYIGTKQAQRAGEAMLLAAEKFATIASLLGATYPTATLDKAWRQLLFGSHHDGITGTESDQVYIDLLGGWRDTWEFARAALDDALDHVGRRVDTRGPGHPSCAEARAINVFNPLSWERDDLVELVLDGSTGTRLEIRDDRGGIVPHVVEDVVTDGDGNPRALVSFLARDVPSLGVRTHHVVELASDRDLATWVEAEGTTIASDRWNVSVDPARGGAITSLVDRRDGTEYVRAGELANELVVQVEYPSHPDHGEGPWHLLPTGEEARQGDVPAEVVREVSPIGQRLVVRTTVDGCAVTQRITVLDGIDRVDLSTGLDGFNGRDRLVRLSHAVDVPGGMPISETADAVVGRGFGFPNVDTAVTPYTLDHPAHNWFGIGTTARIELRDLGAPTASRAIAVAEVVTEDPTAQVVRDLVVSLVQQGVTATVSTATGPRQGSSEVDSNLPDVRIALGGPDDNAFARAVLAGHPALADQLRAGLDRDGMALVLVPARVPLAEAWRPGVDLRPVDAVPALVAATQDEGALRRLVDRVAADLADHHAIVVDQPTGPAWSGTAASRTVAVVNRGMPGFNVDVAGTLHLSLMRSCSGWPSGVWLDPPRRTTPDGASFQLQHWSHTFDHALVAGVGDWRRLELVRRGQECNTPLLARPAPSAGGDLPSGTSFLTVEGDVVVTAMKPAGNPLAEGSAEPSDPVEGIALRLHEPHGRSTTARVHWSGPVASAARADLLEVPGEPLAVDGATVSVPLDPLAIATVHLHPGPAGASAVGDRPLGHAGEPAQPIHAEYWLHNKGAAPVGNQLVTARMVDRAVQATGALACDVVVASSRTDGAVSGWAELHAPAGWRVEPERFPYHLPPSGSVRRTVHVEPPGDVAPGRWFVAIRVTDQLGQEHEDVLTVDFGDAPSPPVPTGHRTLVLERATRRAAVVDDTVDPDPTFAFGGEVTAALAADELRVTPGQTTPLVVDLANRARGDLHAEVQLVSPWGTWHLVAPWTTGVVVPGGCERSVTFELCCPPGQRPVEAWALAKVMYAGRVLYTDTCRLVVGP